MKAKRFSPAFYRKEFPFVKNVIYFDHASDGPIPLSSYKAIQDYYRYLLLENIPTSHKYQFSVLEESRNLAASLIKAKASEIGIAPNTSYGLNVVAQGLKLKRGDTVLLSDIEFPANVYPWLNLRQDGVKVKFIKSRNGFFSIDDFLKAIDQTVRVLSLSFVQYFNGYKNDLEAIGKICQERGIIFVVDGIQGVGNQILDVNKCRIDFLSCGASKWLLSSPGTAFFYASEKLQRRLKSVFFGWLGVDWKEKFEELSHYDKPPFLSARKFEIGTYPYALLYILANSLKLISGIGVSNIERHTRQLLDPLIEYLQDSPYEIKSSLKSEHRSAILSFTCPNAEALHRKLMKNKIICSFREKCLRLSPHFYNTSDEIELLVQILRRNQP